MSRVLPTLSEFVLKQVSPLVVMCLFMLLLSVFGTASAVAANLSPVADAGPDQTITLATGESAIDVVLNGSGSNDPDGKLVYFDWQGLPNPADRQSPTVRLAEGTHTFSLFVRDDQRWRSNTDTVTVTVLPNSVAVNQSPIADAGQDQTITLNSGQTTASVTLNGSGSNDPDGATLRYYNWQGTPNPADRVSPTVTLSEGTYTFSLFVRDDQRWKSNTDTVTVTVSAGGPPPVSNVSINSTSRNGPVMSPVFEKAFVTNPDYQILAANDLGMHCGDLDTRISSILPPFNVVHAQVVERGQNGNEPRILGEDEVELEYSAASNPNDPALSKASELAKNGNVFKTNFWEIVSQSYAPFYPPGILDAFYTPGADINDIGLPVPDVERLYLEDGELHASQVAMPGIGAAYLQNEKQAFNEHIGTLPFFINFPFGYTSDVNLFEAAGIPITAFDDSGRPNAYPLMRVQAKNTAGSVIASLDTVVPVSGEAECQICHADTFDGGNGAATQTLADEGIPLALSIDDPSADVTNKASVEWASDINLLRLHDFKHNTNLYQGVDANGRASNPVVCQTCHYTPALDLAQVGPKGGNDPDANGRQQLSQSTMSNVMHGHHASVTGVNGEVLFPDMPPAVDANGNKRAPLLTAQILQETCYACHPGRDTECMRGAMANGGMVCQDCHGDMEQVGSDFSENVTPQNPGAFVVAADFYTNPATPRVPWANEPGCGSCHTGDAMNNMAAAGNTLTNPRDIAGNADGIRLLQAFRTDDAKATPIVPDNKRFAENTVESGEAAGNPKLYRVSTGHGGLFCQACHGSTHAEWPNADPNANDNVAANQIQGHSGTITECSSCHEGGLGNTLDGPHGMHVVGGSGFADGGHDNIAETNPDACRVCHGRNGEGTVLSRTSVARSFTIGECKDGTLCPNGEANNFRVNLAKGTEISCVMCHENEL